MKSFREAVFMVPLKVFIAFEVGFNGINCVRRSRGDNKQKWKKRIAACIH